MNDTLTAIEAEQSILGLLMAYSATFDLIGPLKAEHFYRADHRAIFEAAVPLLTAGHTADVITVFERMKASAPDFADVGYLNELATGAWAPSGMRRHVEIVVEKSRRRELAASLHAIADAAANDPAIDVLELVDRAQSQLQGMTDQQDETGAVLAADDVQALLDDLDKRSRGEGTQAMTTGFVDLDQRLGGGIRPGNLIVVAARPKMGKTALALNIARNVAVDHKVLVLSMEMKREDLHHRNLAALGRVPLAHIVDAKKMQGGDWSGSTKGGEQLAALGLSVYANGEMRLAQVRAVARQSQRKHGLDLLVIDYLQLMQGDGDTRNAQIEQITRGLKGMAMSMGIGIILLSQLNRQVEGRPNRRPMPSDLRDSGAIEQDCDAALFLYRDEIYNPNTLDRGICEVNVGLNRQGESGIVGLAFIASQARFETLQRGHEFGRPQEPVYSMQLKD